MSSKITALTAYASPLGTDVLPVVDLTGPTTKKATLAALVGAIVSPTTVSGAGAVPKAGANGNLAPGWLRRKLATNTDTGTQNNWAPGVDGDTFLPWAGLADLTVTGLAGGVSGDIFIFKNTGTSNAFFPNLSGSSAAGSLFTNIVTSGPTPVSVGGFAAWAHDGTSWQLIAHEQGKFITAAYNAANFTADAGTWGVDAGDITTLRYKVDGARIYVEWVIFTSSTSSTPTFLKIGNGAYGGYTAAASQVLQTSVIYSDAGGSLTSAFAETGSLVNVGQIFIAKTGGLGWSVNTNTLYVYGGLSFDIT